MNIKKTLWVRWRCQRHIYLIMSEQDKIQTECKRNFWAVMFWSISKKYIIVIAYTVKKKKTASHPWPRIWKHFCEVDVNQRTEKQTRSSPLSHLQCAALRYAFRSFALNSNLFVFFKSLKLLASFKQRQQNNNSNIKVF